MDEPVNNIEKINLDDLKWKDPEDLLSFLKSELKKLDTRDESYSFTWVGKRKSIIESGSPIEKTLRPDLDASKDFDSTKNMLIVGDNLDALKLLQESYLGKVKMIYIDPPYNTGHDFVYHDNFTIKKSDYDDNSTDENGNKIISEDEFLENSKSNGRFHSDWLSMMYPRLKLARNLLADDGVIFISIDDNEQANLKKLCDEVFGEENFVSNMVWAGNRTGKNDSENIKNVHEYILVYLKNHLDGHLSGIADTDDQKYKFSDARGPYYLITLDQSSLGYSAGMDYPLEHDGVTYYPGIDKAEWEKRQSGAHSDRDWIWRWRKEKVEEALKNDYIVFKNGRVYTKQYRDYDADGNKIDRTVLKESVINEYATRGGKDLLKKIFEREIFTYAKPLPLIEDFMKLVPSRDALILDFFAGSGTTGHAVMDLNAADGGNRKYILVQLDEPVAEKSEAAKAGYHTIDEITAERLRRAGDKIAEDNPNSKNLDTGFRVFRLDSTNEREDLRKPLGDIKQEDLFDAIDNIKKDRTPLDLLFGAIIYLSLPLDKKLQTETINNCTIYKYGYLEENSGLIACFDDNLDDETTKKIAKLKPLTAVFKDSSFQDSAAKINLSEIFRTISPDTKVKII